jgi:uncharacterized membrane protein YhaH (DUF805 family)
MLPFSSVIGNGERLAMVLVGLVYLVVLVAVAALWVRRRKRGAWKAYLPVVFVAALPVLWFVVMAQHSQVHFFYTYRIQMISYFGIMSSFVCCIRWKDGDVA